MSEAQNHYDTAMELKGKGDIEKALTWFRRAVIAQPSMTLAHLEIGRICRDKARLDPMFQRYAFEAFRSAARLDLNLQEAHDSYILLAQQMKILDQLHDEYENWAKQNPNNDVVQRAYKNLVAISMAMFSTQSDVGRAQASSSMKKLVFVVSFLSMIIGAGLIFLPPLFTKSGKISKEQLKSFLIVGALMGGAGLGGLLFHRRME